MKRKKFLKIIAKTTSIIAITGLYSWQIEPFWLEFVRIKMPVDNLPKKLIGKTVMQISDIHVEKEHDVKYLIKSFNKAKSYNPDFVVYTGDYLNYRGKQQLHLLNETIKNAVKGKLGTIAILGNHDYGFNWKDRSIADKVSKIFSNFNITVLRNQQKEISGLNFIGFDDYWGPNFNPKKVMNQYDKSKANIVLCHNPDVCDVNIWNGYKGWILSGHTHGGQFKPPFLDPPVLPVKNRRYTLGLIDLADGRRLYINRALGNLWQLRFNVRPEITVFELEILYNKSE